VRALRPLATALAWIALFTGVGGGVGLLLIKCSGVAADHSGLAIPDQTSPWFLPVFAPSFLIGFGVATWGIGARLAKCSWTELGWRADVVRSLARGFAVGALAATLATALTIVPGGAHVRFAAHWTAYFHAALPLVLGLLAAALIEELAFRGFPLHRLAAVLGAWPATLFLAVAFGMVHLGNPNASLFGILNVALAGIWLSIAFFSPGGIALGWGLHFGWNLGLALLGAPVSGMHLAPPQAVYHPGLHAWFDGGAFGPEGGLVGTIAIVSGAAAILGSRVGRPKLWVAA
jgi:CAAX protease family protein